MTKAQIIKRGAVAAIKSDYNTSLIAELKAIPGRRWNGATKCWEIPLPHEEAAREILRKYFPIEDELNVEPAREIIKARVQAGNSSKRNYSGGVKIDGIDVISTLTGAINLKPNSAFEVLESSVGTWLRGDARHAFDIEYTVVLKVRQGADWESYGNANHVGAFEILERRDLEVAQ